MYNRENNSLQAAHKKNTMQTADNNAVKYEEKDKPDEMIYQLQLPFNEFAVDDNVCGLTDCTTEENEKIQNLLDHLLEECKSVCLSANITIGQVHSISVNKKLCRVWGRCVSLHDRSAFLIELNEDLLKESVPITSIKSVILHELCHTVPGGYGHKNGWKDAVEKLKPFGYQLPRCSSAKELGVPEKSKDEYKYVFRCQGCGILIHKCKASKFVKNCGHYKCEICGRRLEKIF